MATRAVAPRLAAERRFYFWMAAAILATIFAGFAPSFYLRGLVATRAPLGSLTPLVVLHGLLFSGWAILFMVQVSLVSAGRTDLHRRLGLAGFAMLAGMAVVGPLTALFAVARNLGPPSLSPLSWLAVPLVDVPMYVSLIVLGFANRSRPQVHKRFMLASMIGMINPAAGRLPWPAIVPVPLVLMGGMLIFLTALIAWDLISRGKLHWATSISVVILVGSWVFRLAVWQAPWWLAFAGWVSAPFA
jgi:hypothetical protein